MGFKLAEVANHVSGQVIGDSEYEISDVGTLQNATSSQLAFLSNPKYKKFLLDTQAGAVIIGSGVSEERLPDNINFISVDDPYVAYAKAASLIKPEKRLRSSVHPTAVIDPSAKVADDVYIAPYVVIQANVVIGSGVQIDAGSIIESDSEVGDGSWIKSNVVISYGTIIGQNVIIHPGVVIGADGFGIANDNGKWIKVPQLGAVVIGDNVEIGANTTIDRGAIDNTFIGEGVKLDNQIQIGHNVEIGAHTVMAGNTSVAGSTKIGRYCAIGGHSAINGHIDIADGVQLTGMSAVSKSIKEKGVYSSGIPVEPNRQWHKSVMRYRQLNTLFERVKSLEEKQKD